MGVPDVFVADLNSFGGFNQSGHQELNLENESPVDNSNFESS